MTVALPPRVLALRTLAPAPQAAPTPATTPAATAAVATAPTAVADRFDAALGAAVTPAIKVPVVPKALAAFRGYIDTPVGEVFVEIEPGKSPGNMFFFDGLDACGRPIPTDMTTVRLELIGQNRTLARDIITTGGRSVRGDISPETQIIAAATVLAKLDLGGPVHVMGLSYGGFIAALLKSALPERIDALVLCSPYVHTTGKGDVLRDITYAALMHPLNIAGEMLYRFAARAALMGGMATVPPALAGVAPMYVEAMYRLSMGLEGLYLREIIKGMDNVHIIAAPADPLSPPASSQTAHDGVNSGSYTMASVVLTMQHDLVRMAPSLVRDVVSKATTGAAS